MAAEPTEMLPLVPLTEPEVAFRVTVSRLLSVTVTVAVPLTSVTVAGVRRLVVGFWRERGDITVVAVAVLVVTGDR